MDKINARDYFNPMTLMQLSQIANNYNTSWQPNFQNRLNPQIKTLEDLSTLANQIYNYKRQGYIPTYDRGFYPMNYSEY